jgi:hypothetical protein
MFSLGFAIIFGIVVIAAAVAPGTILNPTFGPTDDDIAPPGKVACTWTGWYCGDPYDYYNPNCRGHNSDDNGDYDVVDAYCDAGKVTMLKNHRFYID